MTDFADQIRTRYPEGLTAIFAIGATRRTYLMLYRDQLQPGQIDDFDRMASEIHRLYLRLLGDFFALGGQNVIVPVLSYRSFFERGEQYFRHVIPAATKLTNEDSLAFYEQWQVDPYISGLEVLLRQPEGSPLHDLARTYQQFTAEWPYQPGRRKVIWEIASIPPLVFWEMIGGLSDEERQMIEHRIEQTGSLEQIQQVLYKEFTGRVFGTELPMPHFYLGSNMSGDIKYRAPMALALTGGEYLRGYYLPYPTLFLTRENLQRILEDLAFGERLNAPQQLDYSDKYTAALVEAEYQRVLQLAADPEAILGLTRKIKR
ncbi:MAG: hypothetical protein MUF87_13445 [Anaerolineae bacterium]|jgi:hypothetical protein|nr:hypothetical protein [Anaerolineae bacterium]